MQRLADRIYKEFAFAEQPIEVHALDGNGDMFQVYKGPVSSLSAYSFVQVLQDPGCFYFFAVACNPSGDPYMDPDTIIRRDLCWLTDPLPPALECPAERSLSISWDAVSFCGVDSPEVLDAVSYSLEVAEGVEWKDCMLARYINDMTALDYREVCHLKNQTHFVVEHLLPARWYHVRLVVHYLGFRVVSEASTVHTLKAAPSPPGEPRISIIPVKSSFDVVSDQPARLDVCVTWTPAMANGSPIQRYQVHLRRFDHDGYALQDEPPLLKKKPLPEIKNSDRAIGGLVKLDRMANQWTQSKGKSVSQIQNSLTQRSQSPTKLRSRSPSRSSMDSQVLPPSPGSGTSWRIVYDNLSRTVRLGSPHVHDGTWWIRIRAKNSLGWSDFSKTLVMSRASHPTLFSPADGMSSSMSMSHASVTVRPPSRDAHFRREDFQASHASIEEEKPATPFTQFEQMLKGGHPNANTHGSADSRAGSEDGHGQGHGPPALNSLHWNHRTSGSERPSSRPANAFGGMGMDEHKSSALPAIR